MPIGFYEEMFPKIDDFDAVFKMRDLPIIYVGRPKRGKFEKYARKFGKKFRIYNRKLDLTYKMYYFVTTGHYIVPFTGSISELYQRSMIGLNTHETFGPSNVRMYQLNAAGVAQVLDCPESNHVVYEPNSEIISYSNLDEAIEKTKILLNDKALRYKISKNGYERARSCYNRRDLLIKLFECI